MAWRSLCRFTLYLVNLRILVALNLGVRCNDCVFFAWVVVLIPVLTSVRLLVECLLWIAGVVM